MPAKILRAISILSGVLYLFTGGVVLKGLAVGPLAVLAFVSASPMLGAALAVSTLGDVLLDLDPEKLFVFGLGSFLLAHLIYLWTFIRNRTRPLALGVAQIVPTALVLVYSVSVSAWLLPSLGGLIVPVAIYMCAITAMVLSAILARFSNPWVAVGAILFLISDSLLAINKFKTPVPLRDVLVWSTYYAGQFAIANGFLARQRSTR
ncbi:MAG TPA: lysoplasmalogenase [Bryobacteraceae bacterium]|nr:lysoplasmalogenase [Bryobacteraceae bacterium]